MTITLKRTVNLSEPILPEVLPAPLYEGEKNAHTFMITAEKDKLPHALSGSVVAYFERNDGNTVRVEGETKDGAAILTLSPECYQTGVFYLAVMLISDGAQTVIYAASGRVRNTQDGEIIDGGNTIPTYDEIMAHLEKYLSTDITAKVEETEGGALITMKDVVNGETTAVVKNGKPGAAGDTGATFRPAVSENGIITWTNDKNLENPEPVNIKGPEGKSAYEIAKDEGFEGTEEEWLETLKNKDIIVISLNGEPSANFPDAIVLKHDYTYAQIKNWVEGGKTLLLRDIDGKVYTFSHITKVVNRDDAYTFRAVGAYKSSVGLEQKTIEINQSFYASRTSYGGLDSPIKTPNPQKLIMTDDEGNEVFAYDGSEEVIFNQNKDGGSCGGSSGGTFETPTDEEILQALIESDFLLAVQDENGAILTDENGDIILM